MLKTPAFKSVTEANLYNFFMCISLVGNVYLIRHTVKQGLDLVKLTGLPFDPGIPGGPVLPCGL